MPVEQGTPTAAGYRPGNGGSRRHGDNAVDPAFQARKQLHDLFGRIEGEFERVYLENLSLREKLDQLTEKLVNAGGDRNDGNPIVAPAEDQQKSAKKGNQLSQRLKSTYKTSTTRLANTFRISVCGRLVKDFQGHADGVWEVTAATHQGARILATASADSTAKVWSVDSGLVLVEYLGHHGSVNSARFHPFKNLVVTGSGDRTAHVWSVQASSALVAVSRPMASPTSSYAGFMSLFTRRSQSVPVGDRTNDLPDVPEPTGLDGDSAGRAQEAVARDEVPAGFDEDDVGILRRGELATVAGGNCIRTPLAVLCGHTDVVSAADWLNDGSRIITASWDGTAAAHDPERSSSGDSIVETLVGHERELTNVSTHSTQKLVLTTSKDTSIRLWDLRLPSSPVTAFSGHTASVSSAVFAPSDRVVSGSDDRTVKLWDMRNMAAPYSTIRSDSAVNRLSVCPSTGTIAVPHDNRHIRLYDGATSVRLGCMPRSSRLGHTRMVCCTAWLDESSGGAVPTSAAGIRGTCNLFSAGFDGRVLGWQANTRSA